MWWCWLKSWESTGWNFWGSYLFFLIKRGRVSWHVPFALCSFCLPLVLFVLSGTAVEGLEVGQPFCNHKDEISVLRLVALAARRSSAPL